MATAPQDRTPGEGETNRLYFGDNLKWLRDRNEFPNQNVNLSYLDPPFDSNADYDVLFRETSGQVSQAQFHVFGAVRVGATPFLRPE